MIYKMKVSLCVNEINKQIDIRNKRYVKMNRIWLFNNLKSINSNCNSGVIYGIIRDNKLKEFICDKCGEFLSKFFHKKYYQCSCGICLVTF